jgi:hypothetical protein
MLVSNKVLLLLSTLLTFQSPTVTLDYVRSIAESITRGYRRAPERQDQQSHKGARRQVDFSGSNCSCTAQLSTNIHQSFSFSSLRYIDSHASPIDRNSRVSRRGLPLYTRIRQHDFSTLLRCPTVRATDFIWPAMMARMAMRLPSRRRK